MGKRFGQLVRVSSIGIQVFECSCSIVRFVFMNPLAYSPFCECAKLLNP